MARTDVKSKLLPREDDSDEPDLIRGAFMKSALRTQSVPPKTRNVFGANPKSAAKESGAVDEEQFREAFNDYTTVTVSSGHEVETELMKINATLSNPNEDWEKRVEQLRRLRGLVVAGATGYKEFQGAFRYLDLSLQLCVKDLRSQVVRESCITLAFLAETLEMRCERTAEMNLPVLLLLIPNSVKVMASSGVVCIRMILTYVHSPKLIPIITREYLTSKSKEIRRACCEFMCLFLGKFPKSSLEKHLATIQEAIKKGMADADSDARSLARQAFFAFGLNFPSLANALYKELDAPKQKILDEQMPPQPPRSDSQTSIKSLGSNGAGPSRMTPSASKTNFENLGVACALRMGQDQVEKNGRPEVKNRSSSAIDMAAARRAKAKVLPTSSSRTLRPPTRPAAGPPVTRGRAPPVQSFARSQPGSRSNSPSNARYPTSALSKRTPGTLSRDESPSGRSAVKNLSAYKGGGGGGAGGLSFSRKGSHDSSQFHDEYDESETSSVASEQSGFGRFQDMAGTSLRDNLPDILAQLSSGNWTTKRDGLLSLQRYVNNGSHRLSHSEIDHISSLFTRMMNDPTTKVIGIFLDTLFEFVKAYKLELSSWLYVLMTKLLSKQGAAELVGTVQGKIEKLFHLIRCSFPGDVQFQHLMRFITDQTQTLNVRVKAAVLHYMCSLVQSHMKEEEFRNCSSVRLGLTRVIQWCVEGKTPEVRRCSQQVLIALRQLNEREFSALLDTLDEFLRDSAGKLINGYPRRPSGLLEELARAPPAATPQRGLPSAAKPAASVPQVRERALGTPLSSPSQASSGNEENLNPDAVLRHLRQTSQDIQKYGYAPSQTTPMPTPSLSGSNDISPYYNDHSVVPVYASSEEQIGYLTTLTERMAASSHEKKYAILRHLNAYLPLITEDVWEEYFLTILSFLYENFQNISNESVAFSLSSFGQLFRLQPTRMRLYPELNLVNIIEVQKSSSKLVLKAAEDCAWLAAKTFPCDVTAKILVPIINNQPHPENSAAVRLFSFMVKQATKEEIVPILPIVIPSLIKAYADNRESNMRKDCVYALIYTQIKVGEELMAEYVNQLPASKVRLMKLYLKRTVELGGEGDVEGAADGTPKTDGDTPL